MQEYSPASVIQSADRHPEDYMSDDPTGTRIRCHRASGSNQRRDSGCLSLVALAKRACNQINGGAPRRSVRRSRASGNPGISVTCPAPPLSRGRRIRAGAQLDDRLEGGGSGLAALLVPAFAGHDDEVGECRTLEAYD